MSVNKSNRTLAQKMGIKENSRAIFVNADKETFGDINLPNLDISTKFEDEFDNIHLFVKSQSEFNEHFPKLKPQLCEVCNFEPPTTPI